VNRSMVISPIDCIHPLCYYVVMSDKLYTLDDVAQIVDRAVAVVRRHVRTGKLDAHKVGRRYFVTDSNISEYKRYIEAVDITYQRK